MCGIVGSYRAGLSTDDITDCSNKLKHRGPDDAGIWSNDRCILAHRRLSILDISSLGHQPMLTSDGRYVLVYNGEIYNYVEIRDELRNLGYSFISDSDTEVILYAFQEWKEKCLNKFNGMWAFAIYDLKQDILFLARDRFGIKPLFYSSLNGGFVFASEMKALIPIMPKATPNVSILCNYRKVMEYEHTEECLISEIKRFPAATYAWIDAKGMQLTRWWDTLDNLIDVPNSYEEQVELFRTIFLDACKIRMRSDVTIGTALSGGLDSSATICTMAHISKSMNVNIDFQHAFSATFTGTSQDESKYSDIVSKYLGIQYTKVEIDPYIGLKEMGKDIYNFEEIYSTSPIPMMQLYRAFRNNNVLVTLDGHGADELFAGYTFEMLYALLEKNNFQEERNIIDTYLNGKTNANSNIESSNYLYSNISFDFKLRYLAKRILQMKDRDRFIGNTCIENFNKLDKMNKVLFNSSHNTVLPTLFRNYDHYSMASGVEIRMPFMDYRLVSLAFSVDYHTKLHGGYSKAIIRDALSPFMPEEIVKRKSKIGFNTPIVEWMKGPWKEWLMDSIHSSEFVNCNLIHADEVKKDIMKVIADSQCSYTFAEQTWTKYMPYLWEKHFYKQEVIV